MIKTVWKALFESNRTQLKELTIKVKAMEEKLIELAMHSHEPKNYKEKCDAMEERIEALEKKVHMIR